MRARATYANVMSTVAVLIALGGSSYAVSRINGSTIRDRSIPGKKLKRSAVTAKEIDTRGLTVPTAKASGQALVAGRALTADRATAADRATSAAAVDGLFLANRPKAGRRVAGRQADQPSTIVRANFGESKTILTDGAYTVTLTCSGGPGSVHAVVSVQTTLPDTLVSIGNQLIQPGESATLDDATQNTTGRTVEIESSAGLVTSPTGPTLNLNQITIGANYGGADCFASTFAIGG
ncbi:MAG: hypothetical protein QOJ29_3554 [Thermoleophilaceae bacterium]|jgi:hypothetical protein|nr:hypothetical protein [Thermoleophilaceae bacterium]